MKGAAKKGMMDFVRRRRWVRKRRQVAQGAAAEPVRSSHSGSGAQAPMAPSHFSNTSTPSIRTLRTAADQRAEQGSQTPLGMVAAGDSIPLPQGWSARGSQLQVLMPAVTTPPFAMQCAHSI